MECLRYTFSSPDSSHKLRFVSHQNNMNKRTNFENYEQEIIDLDFNKNDKIKHICRCFQTLTRAQRFTISYFSSCMWCLSVKLLKV